MRNDRCHRETGPRRATESPAGPSRRRSGNWTPFSLAVLALAVVLTSGQVFAQDESAQSLAERSAIIVRGKVLKTNASNEAMVAASNRTAVITVGRMYAGSEIAGDQTGKTATVILSRPDRLKAGEEAIFFGNPRFVGRSLTIADEGEISSNAAVSSADTDLERAAQIRKDKPVLDRLADASLVFRGSVEAVRPLDAGVDSTNAPAERRSEHDPEWHVATVRVATSLKSAEAGQIVTVIFSASRDIAWFHAPKLKAAQDAVFITHALTKENAGQYRTSALAALLEKQPAHAVTEPSDVLPAADEARVRALLSSAKEGK